MTNTRHQAEQALKDGRELAAGGYSIGSRAGKRSGWAVERGDDGKLVSTRVRYY